MRRTKERMGIFYERVVRTMLLRGNSKLEGRKLIVGEDGKYVEAKPFELELKRSKQEVVEKSDNFFEVVVNLDRGIEMVDDGARVVLDPGLNFKTLCVDFASTSNCFFQGTINQNHD
eukprot:m.28734 g.28734  ORF g.28734 m.28734 type:complete len:117 (-) comp6084_c0_seq1:511-861(-)